jgi:DNA repair protein RadC
MSAETSNQPGFDDEPHYHGHRERLRKRFRGAGADALSDYELLEMVLFRAIARRDVKPLAKLLIGKFGSFAEVVHAPDARLREVAGLGEAAITEIKLIAAAASRVAKGQLKARTMLSSWSDLIDYCRTAMAFADKEQFRVLFLDKRNQLISDELSRSAPSIIPRCIRAKSSSARWNCRPPPSSWCTTTPPAIRPRRRRISR